MGVSQIRGTILGIPILRTIVFWGLYLGPLIWGICSAALLEAPGLGLYFGHLDLHVP